MSALDELQRWSFAGIGFSALRWSVKCGIRSHAHEYPGSPGGQIEKLGRRLIQTTVDAVFSANDPARDGVVEPHFPGKWNELVLLFEKGETGPLVIPTLGTIETAICLDWDHEVDPARMRDGIRAKLFFTEDSEEELSVSDVIQATASSLANKLELLLEEIAPLEEPEPDLFESIEGLCNEVQGVLDQAELANDQLGAKIEGVTGKMQQLDESISELGDPENWAVTRALHDMGATLVAYGQAVAQAFSPPTTYVTPKLMSVTEVSIALYGDTSAAMELLKANRDVINDAFAIPEGTTLKAA
jgi:prophage DNA circulation protein